MKKQGRITSLQLIRESQGKSRDDCAVALRVHVHTWKRWELGYAAPSAALLLDIAALLGVPAEHLRDIVHGDDGRRHQPKREPRPATRRGSLPVTATDEGDPT